MTEEDASHLNLLSLFHYVLGGLGALVSSLFIIHVVMGLSMLHGQPWLGIPAGGSSAPRGVGVMVTVMGGTVVVLGWALAACLVVAGHSLSVRKRYRFCLVTAGLACLFCNPLGLILGVFTILVLLRPGVKQSFGLSVENPSPH